MIERTSKIDEKDGVRVRQMTLIFDSLRLKHKDAMDEMNYSMYGLLFANVKQ